MKIFDFLVKIAVFRASLLFLGDSCHAFPPGSHNGLRPYINHKISLQFEHYFEHFLPLHNLFMMLVHMEVHFKVSISYIKASFLANLIINFSETNQLFI